MLFCPFSFIFYDFITPSSALLAILDSIWYTWIWRTHTLDRVSRGPYLHKIAKKSLSPTISHTWGGYNRTNMHSGSRSPSWILRENQGSKIYFCQKMFLKGLNYSEKHFLLDWKIWNTYIIFFTNLFYPNGRHIEFWHFGLLWSSFGNF